METIKKYLHIRFLIGILGGLILGYAYYYFVGCKSGTCSITSDPVNSSLYGALLGAVLTFGKKKNKKSNSSTSETT